MHPPGYYEPPEWNVLRETRDCAHCGYEYHHDYQSPEPCPQCCTYYYDPLDATPSAWAIWNRKEEEFLSTTFPSDIAATKFLCDMSLDMCVYRVVPYGGEQFLQLRNSGSHAKFRASINPGGNAGAGI